MALIEGVDYELCSVDYDEHDREILRATFETDSRSLHEPLWHFLDVVFDRGVRDPINMTVEFVFREAEDFCNSHGIAPVPALYQTVFECRGGFLAQAKVPMLISDIWLDRFPMPIPTRRFEDSILDDFASFLEQKKMQSSENLEMVKVVLSCLEEFTAVPHS
jgi:hypothetical protein